MICVALYDIRRGNMILPRLRKKCKKYSILPLANEVYGIRCLGIYEQVKKRSAICL